ncbi:2OG-Fe dioxygenase family protein [Hydrogenophaga sp.]|uniref:2OG-Fe dioxygenase family protein n=1 Tax=Hydrogenophaga sp. TaxID=1904254 RepID=UPI002731F6C8|nr:2OG-Fe dioxygenase family protein [Hydrogenophaga sp.]MDP2017046.1 2OG-Fe dioxygenase family protein [Hydrogenophaga sp.]MDP3811043.1 2OG-Fe dioxygenase family protein [Hydrogenophaga sp.]
MTSEFQPPYVPLHQLDASLKTTGFALLSAASVAEWLPTTAGELQALHAGWDHLPADAYLKDGGHYRSRRHSCFVVNAEQVQQSPHRAHWQPLEYNALHGGMQRWFEPMEPAVVAQPVWGRLLARLGAVASALRGEQPWFVESHPFRIDTTDGIGRPTPEGAHRDGVDLVAVFMVGRHGIKGGESRVFEANGPGGQRFTLREPWSLLLLDDARVIHESTPIQPLEGDALGWRDTLVVTCRAGGFQGD